MERNVVWLGLTLEVFLNTQLFEGFTQENTVLVQWSSGYPVSPKLMTFSSIWPSYHMISTIISRPINRHSSKIKSNLDHYSTFITYSLFSVWIRPVISVTYQSLRWNFKPLIIPGFAGIKCHFKYPFNNFLVANEVHFSRFFSPLKAHWTPKSL